MSSRLREMVTEFMVAMGQPIGAPLTEHREMRLSLILEETAELATAMAADDLVGVADALADLAYVTMGGAVTWGIEVPPVYDEELVSEWDISGLSIVVRRAADTSFHLVSGRSARGVSYSLWQLLRMVRCFAYGYGIPLDEVLEEVHRSNMAKSNAPVRADGKILKPPGWTPPDVEGVLRRAGLLGGEQ